VKILFVNYEYPPLGGGGGVALSHLVNELSQMHEITVLTSGAPGLPKTEQQGGATIHRARVLGRHSRAVASMISMYSFYYSGYWRGLRVLKNDHVDLINTWFAVPSGPTGLRLSEKMKTHHVLTLIGGDVYDPSKWYSPHRNLFLRSVVRSVMGQSRRCTAISTDVRDRARELFGREISIDVLPLPIARPRYRPADRMMLDLDRDAFYCITVGRLIPRKRLGLLLEGFAKSFDPNLRLLLVGEGPEEKRLRKRVEELQLAKRVQFLGALPDEKKFQYLANSDAYVCVSSHEGFGLAFLEAMACGLPVIAPNTGGQRDFLIHGKTGLTIEPDGEDVLRRINELLDSPEKTIEMREHNRYYVERFYAETVAEIWSETFQRYLKEMY
jgi:glycosyltransferase involved in cell wall biosynthesis